MNDDVKPVPSFHLSFRQLRRVRENAALLLESADFLSFTAVLALGFRLFRSVREDLGRLNEETDRFFSTLLRNQMPEFEGDDRWAQSASMRTEALTASEEAECENRLKRFERYVDILERRTKGLVPDPPFIDPVLLARLLKGGVLVLILAGIIGAAWAGRAVRFRHNGLIGQYFPNMDLTDTPVTRRDGPIDFQWYKRTPARGFPPDRFSARWTGSIEIPEEGPWTFILVADDGLRFWIDDRLLIDRWTARPADAQSAVLDLTAGRHALKLEYVEESGDAAIQLFWERPGKRRAIVPLSQLFLP